MLLVRNFLIALYSFYPMAINWKVKWFSFKKRRAGDCL